MPLLHDWLPEWVESSVDEFDCMGLVSDSRLVSPGVVFLAYPGRAGDGRDFMADAIQRGAAAIIYEVPCVQAENLDVSIPLIPVARLRERLCELASCFYQAPSTQLNTVAITGTDGKTSCMDLLAQALTSQHQRCGVMGTLGVGLWPDYQPTGMTTVDVVSMHRGCYNYSSNKQKHWC